MEDTDREVRKLLPRNLCVETVENQKDKTVGVSVEIWTTNHLNTSQKRYSCSLFAL
jgi:hypothetical protein